MSKPKKIYLPTGQGVHRSVIEPPEGKILIQDVVMLSVISKQNSGLCVGKKDQLFFIHNKHLMEEYKRITRGRCVCISRPLYTIFEKHDKQFFLKRRVMVLTKEKGVIFPGCDVCHSPEEAFRIADGRTLFVLGGPETHKSFRDKQSRLIIIWTPEYISGGNVFLNEIPDEFLQGKKIPIIHEEKDGFRFSVVTYHKRRLLSR